MWCMTRDTVSVISAILISVPYSFVLFMVHTSVQSFLPLISSRLSMYVICQICVCSGTPREASGGDGSEVPHPTVPQESCRELVNCARNGSAQDKSSGKDCHLQYEFDGGWILACYYVLVSHVHLHTTAIFCIYAHIINAAVYLSDNLLYKLCIVEGDIHTGGVCASNEE